MLRIKKGNFANASATPPWRLVHKVKVQTKNFTEEMREG